MWRGLAKLFISDIELIARAPVLFFAIIYPIVLILFLLLIYPLISGSGGAENGLFPGQFYSLTAITLISGIPFIYGLVFSYIHLYEDPCSFRSSIGLMKKMAENILRYRITLSAFLSFIMLLPTIFLTDPVSTEGWLRSIYTSFLLAMMAPFIFQFVVAFTRTRRMWRILSGISVLFLITVPTGLLLHHPWNYFVFFSPFYWVSWAWVIAAPSESFIYGLISLAISLGSTMIFYRYILKKFNGV